MKVNAELRKKCGYIGYIGYMVVFKRFFIVISVTGHFYYWLHGYIKILMLYKP